MAKKKSDKSNHTKNKAHPWRLKNLPCKNDHVFHIKKSDTASPGSSILAEFRKLC